MRDYKTILNETMSEIVIEKSKFFAYVKPIQSEKEATEFVDAIKKKHKDATHNVPVYVVGSHYEIQKYSDDGEPHGTAGMPILSMIKNEGITNLAVVVTRYFGGTKLGTGGLVRAYTQAAKEALVAANIIEMKEMCLLRFEVDYHHHGKLMYYIENHENIYLVDVQFMETVSVTLACEPNLSEHLIEELNELTHNGMARLNMELEMKSFKGGNLI